MFMMITVASLCAVLLAGCLLGLVCRHQPEKWIASDDVILCLAFPLLIVVATGGGVALGWRITHGGLAEVSAEGWIGSAIIAAIFVAVWFVMAPRIRGSRSLPAGADPAPI